MGHAPSSPACVLKIAIATLAFCCTFYGVPVEPNPCTHTCDLIAVVPLGNWFYSCPDCERKLEN